MINKSRTILIVFLMFYLTFLPAIYIVFAQDSSNLEYQIKIDQATLAKGLTAEAFSKKIRLSLVPGVLKESTALHFIELHEDMPANASSTLISRIYQYEFLDKKSYDSHKPFYVQISYDKTDNFLKQVYFFDKTANSWRPLPTKDYPKENFVRTLIHLPFARLAVFSDPKKMTVGTASWYAYKSGNYAASPDFPLGTVVRVTNQANGKMVDVMVNDFGPDRKVHPGRVIDLEKNAFAKLADLGVGTIKVAVEALDVKTLKQPPIIEGVGSNKSDDKIAVTKKTEEVKNTKTVSSKVSEPKITLKSGVIINQKNGKILWEKNSSDVMPLASLTKIVALSVFLETGPSFKTVVTYKQQDEDYNYKYAEKVLVSRLRVKDGETLTVGDLFYSAIVGSANNAVESLVRVSGLDRDSFIARMNEKAEEWGAKSTKFYEPTGLDPNNVSSSLDYAIIAKGALKNAILAKASVLSQYVFATINTKIKHTIKNTDKMISPGGYNIVGSKTGYLDEAGFCLMTNVSEDGKKIIVVTLGATTRAKSFSETSRLIEYGLSKID